MRKEATDLGLSCPRRWARAGQCSNLEHGPNVVIDLVAAPCSHLRAQVISWHKQRNTYTIKCRDGRELEEVIVAAVDERVPAAAKPRVDKWYFMKLDEEPSSTPRWGRSEACALPWTPQRAPRWARRRAPLRGRPQRRHVRQVRCVQEGQGLEAAVFDELRAVAGGPQGLLGAGRGDGG